MISYGEDTIQLLGCGRQDCEDLHAWGPGMRQCYIIHYVIKGSGYLECGGKRFRISKGESFLTRPFTVIHYYPAPEDPWEYTWVDFNGQQVESYLERIRMEQVQSIFPTIDEERILPLYERLQTLELYHTNRQEAGGILLALLGIYGDLLNADEQRLANRSDTRLTTAMTMIYSNYHHSYFDIEALCEKMHISRATLYRIFQEGLATSPKNYLMEYRMAQACKMLTIGMSVKSTAISCGFADPFYFSRAFKQCMGMPPSEYKGQ